MAREDEVRKASQQFYAALNRMANGDAASMSDVWSHGATVTTMHPIGGRDIGWDAIRSSFEQVARLATNGRIELADQHLHVAGDVACEVGVEKGSFALAGQHVAIEHRVTNVYQRENGGWKVIHHHTDVSKAMMDVLSRLGPPPAKA